MVQAISTLFMLALMVLVLKFVIKFARDFIERFFIRKK